MKKIFLSLLFFIILSPLNVFAKNLEFDFAGFGGNGDDQLKSVIETLDGGYIAVGTSNSTDIDGITNKGDYDAVIIKFNVIGEVEWVNSLGGNDYDLFNEIIPANDGGYIAVGNFYSTDIDSLKNNGKSDGMIVKYDENGNLVWSRAYGGNGLDFYHNIISLSDEDYIVLVESYSTDINDLPNMGSYDVVLIKYDNKGNVIWKKSYGGNDSDGANDIVRVNNNEFMVLVSTFSLDIPNLVTENSSDILVHFNSDGVILSQRIIGNNPKHTFDYMEIDSLGNYYFSGYTTSLKIGENSNNGLLDGIITKYDKNLNLVWEKNYGGNNIDTYRKFSLTEDGGVIVVLNSLSNEVKDYKNYGGYDSIMVKYDALGNIEWSENFSGNGNDYLNGVLFLDNNYLLYGYSDSNDIIGYTNKGKSDGLLIKSNYRYDIIKEKFFFGTFDIVQVNNRGKIELFPDMGYELDKIIIKDTKGNIVDYTFKDGYYYFDLYDDVFVNVMYKEIVNPNTGFVNYLVFIVFMIVIMSLAIIITKKKKYL